MFSSIRGLKCEQVRFLDDIEAVVYLAYYFISGILPWEVEFKE
jgi:hypothetical protein